MDRLTAHRSYKIAALIVLIGQVCLVCTGCGLFASMMYVVDNRDVKAEYAGLEHKRVAVVCHTEPSLKYQSNQVPRELAEFVGELLKTRVKKITVLDQMQVAKFSDENNTEDFVQIGKALNVDMIVALDLKRFSLYEGATLYRGKATVRVTVYDIKDGGKKVFDKPMPETLYPPGTPMPAVDKPQEEFQRQFVIKLADQIGRHFYDHDSTADVATDGDFYR